MKESGCDFGSLKKIRRSVWIVPTENGFTDRTNRTVRENGLQIVHKVFRSVKESGCDFGSFKKFRRSVRTIPTENGFTDRTNRTVRENGLRIVHRVFNR